MQWFNNWLMKRAAKERQKSKEGVIYPSPEDADRHHYTQESLNFTLTPATGGIIVAVKRYDAKRDRQITALHIINEDQDVATELGKIAVLELYKI